MTFPLKKCSRNEAGSQDCNVKKMIIKTEESQWANLMLIKINILLCSAAFGLPPIELFPFVESDPFSFIYTFLKLMIHQMLKFLTVSG